jgi:hypothetical protein
MDTILFLLWVLFMVLLIAELIRQQPLALRKRHHR